MALVFTRLDLVKKITEKTGLKKASVKPVVEATFDMMLEMMTEGIQDGDGTKLTIRDFGIFATRYNAPRKVRNFHTGESMMSSGSYSMTFKPAKMVKTAMKDAIPAKPTKKKK